MTISKKKHVINYDPDSFTNRLIIRLLVGYWKKTLNEWEEQSCPDVDYNWPGQGFIAWEDILLGGIEKDMSQEAYRALVTVYLALGIVGYDLFSEYVQQSVQLGLRRWKKVFSIDRIVLTEEQRELLKDVTKFSQIPYSNKRNIFLFSEVEKKKPEGFAAIEKEYDDYMEHEETEAIK